MVLACICCATTPSWLEPECQETEKGLRTAPVEHLPGLKHIPLTVLMQGVHPGYILLL